MELILLERGTLALVDADVRDRLSAAYAELKGTWSASTERSIESDLRVFCSWCASVNAAILPALSQTVVQFIVAQAANEKTVATESAPSRGLEKPRSGRFAQESAEIRMESADFTFHLTIILKASPRFGALSFHGSFIEFTPGRRRLRTTHVCTTTNRSLIS